jgi:Swt1-like HEPN
LTNSRLRDFLFRGLMFESEAVGFQTAGIQIGADPSDAEDRLLVEALAPFGVGRRNQALEMARLYAVLYCFENEIRDFVRETLREKVGADWESKLPPKIKELAESRRATALKDSWLEGEKSDLLGFVEFGHWLKQRMDEMEKVRNFIAHNRMLLPSEFQRLYMYIADWNRVIGL